MPQLAGVNTRMISASPGFCLGPYVHEPSEGLLCEGSNVLPAALLLVPTRELALQTSQVCRELGKFLNLEVMVTFGGMPLKDDIMRLYNTVHVVVATPGRILDLANKGVAKMHNCKILGMDEVIATTTIERAAKVPVFCIGIISLCWLGPTIDPEGVF